MGLGALLRADGSRGFAEADVLGLSVEPSQNDCGSYSARLVTWGVLEVTVTGKNLVFISDGL